MDAESAVTRLIQNLIDAWNRGDKSAFMGHFTPAANYLTSEGECRQGRQSIGELLHDPASVSRVHLSGPVAVRDHGNVATALFRWAADPEIGSEATGVVTCVVVNQNGDWLIDVLQSTDIAR